MPAPRDDRPVLHGDPNPAELQPAGGDLPLADLVDRVLDRGVVVTGDVVIGLAGVDLVYLSLDVVLASVDALRRSIEPESEAG